VQVTVRLFAGLRDIVGGNITERFDTESVTVADLRTRLEASQPKLRPYLSGVAIAVNEDYILDEEHALNDGDTVALVPPIAGGAPSNETPLFLVTTEPLRPQALRDAVMTPASGAAVVFEGVVRNQHEGRTVLRLEYEAYTEMAERQLRAVAEEVLGDFHDREVHAIAAHHRTGPLEVGDISLVVAVSAAHRQDAFEAALRTVDRIKETVPVWKKEYGPDGSHWQEGVRPKPVRR
jgi:molybdopterin synthase catalytic subunit/molybdopterin converting factor small subunit